MHFWSIIYLLGVRILHAEEPKGELSEKGSIYSPIGKRDPFRVEVPVDAKGQGEKANLSGLEKYSVEQFQLRGILRGVGKPHAMFEDPAAHTYILTEGDVIGRERATISRIVNSEVIVTQRTFNYLGAESLLEKVLSLPKTEELDMEMASDGGPQRGTANVGKNGNLSPLQDANPPSPSGGGQQSHPKTSTGEGGASSKP